MSRQNNGFGTTTAVRHPIETIDIYEITGTELESLQQNFSSDLCLEIFISCISIFITTLSTLLGVNLNEQGKAFFFFFIFTILTFLGCIISLLFWLRLRKNKKGIINKIKERAIVE